MNHVMNVTAMVFDDPVTSPRPANVPAASDAAAPAAAATNHRTNFQERPTMSHPSTDHRGSDLLHYASGEELLMLMATSNASMRRQIRRELDERSAVSALGPLGPRRRRISRTDLLRRAA